MANLPVLQILRMESTGAGEARTIILDLLAPDHPSEKALFNAT